MGSISKPVNDEVAKSVKSCNGDGEYSANLSAIKDIVSFLSGCILNNNYKPSATYNEAICLSPEGKEIVLKIQQKESLQDSEINTELKLALLLSSPMYIDIKKTDIEKLTKSVHEEIKLRRILFPYAYGRDLYDKFYELYDEAEKLNYDETMKLLAASPNGIYQVNNLLSGPFGLLKSQENRYLTPIRSVPVYHCSDTACQSLHITKLSTPNSSINEYIEKIYEVEHLVPITKKLLKVSPVVRPSTFEDNSLENLVELLGTFPEEELRVLLAYIIDHEREIRSHFPKDKVFKHYWQDNGDGIVSNLQHAECLQLILLCRDVKIVEYLERAIYENKIHIPSTEVRRPHFTRKRKRVFDTKIECSKYGVRCVVNGTKQQINTSLIRLKNLITKLYLESNNMDKLDWKLRNINGNNITEKIEKFLLSENPKEILMNLIFDNADYVEKTFQYLKYGDFEFPYPSIKEEFVINKVLWKLGFNLTSFPEYLNVFWKRHEQFVKTIKINDDIVSEEYREAIRSAGVNYFVSVEEILDNSLSFITWSLIADHYLDTSFMFNLSDARNFMVEEINSYRYSTNESEYLVLNEEGRNTLFPLIKGFTVLAELCEKYLDEREDYKRPVSEYPFYYNKTDIYLFPFDYKIFLLNLNEFEVRKLIKILKEITGILEINNISNVRNRIKHNRPIHEFPTLAELENTCNVIERVIKMMDSEGITPQLYIYSGTEVDQFGRGGTNYRNYRNVPLQISNNSQFIRCKFPDYKDSQLIIPNINIRNSIDKPRFHYQDKTPYSVFWRNYPKRKMQNEDECD